MGNPTPLKRDLCILLLGTVTSDLLLIVVFGENQYLGRQIFVSTFILHCYVHVLTECLVVGYKHILVVPESL